MMSCGRIAAPVASPVSRFYRQLSRGNLVAETQPSGRHVWKARRAGCHMANIVCVAEAQEAASAAFSHNLRFKRVMLKVSGEALEGQQGFGIDPKVLQTIANEVAAAAAEGVEVAVVVGGGNFFRGVDRWDGLDRASADYVGMLATVMNAICLQSALERLGVETRVQTAIKMQEVAEPYIRRRAVRHLERGRVVIFGAGTGNPFFTTDTAAALRAAEIGADAFLKATKVDGVYDCDPVKYPDAKLHRRLSFSDAQGLRVMDETAVTLCKENNIPVVVFNLTKPGNILGALLGATDIGTHIDSCSGPDAASQQPEGAAGTAGAVQPLQAAGEAGLGPLAAALHRSTKAHLNPEFVETDESDA